MSNPQRSPLPAPTPTTRPNPLQLLFHLGKTARLAGALLADPRITIYRKLVFLGSILLLLLAVIAPETIGSAITEFILPVVGPLVEIPADATLDWVLLVVAGYNLLRVFPPQIVAEHYDRLFHQNMRTVNP